MVRLKSPQPYICVFHTGNYVPGAARFFLPIIKHRKTTSGEGRCWCVGTRGQALPCKLWYGLPGMSVDGHGGWPRAWDVSEAIGSGVFQPPRTAKRASLAGFSFVCLEKKACGGACGERQICLLLLLSEAVPLC